MRRRWRGSDRGGGRRKRRRIGGGRRVWGPLVVICFGWCGDRKEWKSERE